ncbi:MAG: hypothetical protein A2Y62_00880 [Candidatus Fischerbacteria bacterium RBG_13_37_8]|uniref:Uncharacterized protein n=1 Tax=Candidatus Fischerbacteria bacterium RBG_13_37_8 TaxID=1817863 RepID=A0A1F5VK77_9BACT|nr:MAG: hypothetical protein A2Y62_00880 [Candidatus Fischerbacteria bacterium RBG_13_37_8]
MFLRLKQTTHSFSFTIPEQLTGWRILAHIITRDVKTGLLPEETVTQKDLQTHHLAYHRHAQSRSRPERKRRFHLKDFKGAGFEAEELRSGWKWDPISFYEEPRDSLTNFFISWLPHGEYILRYRLRPTTAGTYRIGAAILQSMYAPEFAAHSAGFVLKVEE